MRTTKQIKRQARHLFRLCHVNGSLEEDRVRQILEGILTDKRRGYLALANEFERLVKLERLQHTARVESAVPLSPDIQENVKANLTRIYGPELNMSFAQNQALIGGMRITVGSDVYDGSVQAGLVALEKRF